MNKSVQSLKAASALRARNLIIGGGIAALGMMATPIAAQQVTPGSVDQVRHFFDCLGVLISNPDVHAQNCTPSVVTAGPGSLSPGSYGPSSSSYSSPPG